MTATLAGSAAMLKRKYADGLPKAYFRKFMEWSDLEKDEGWTGDDWALALQSESPQGVSTTISGAQASAAQGAYARFLLTNVEVFGVARIKGAALKKAKGPGAIVDLWLNEIEGITQTVTKEQTICLWRSGNGVKGTSSAISTTLLTLTNIEDANLFSVGETAQLVSDTTLSPTIRSGSAVITAVDRSAGTLTTGSNWTTQITGATAGDSVVRKDFAAVSGVSAAPTGLGQFIVGGSSPGALFALARNSDPVRYAGQLFTATGMPMDDAIIDAESLITTQGRENKLRFFAHTRDLRQLKKKLGARSTIQRQDIKTKAGFSFSVMTMDGDFGPVEVVGSPFVPLQGPFLGDWSKVGCYSAGPAIGLLDFDSQKFVRLGSDDGYEVRVGGYTQNGVTSPVDFVRFTGWGA
jgi:hypothetical protein